jgi:hypothetical protein
MGNRIDDARIGAEQARGITIGYGLNMQALRKIRRCFVVDRHLSIVPFLVFYTLGERDRSVCCSIQREGFEVKDLFHRGSAVILAFILI